MKNYSKDHPDNQIGNMFQKLHKSAKDQRTNQISLKGFFQLPVRSSDPPVTGAGQFGLYYNSGTGKVRKSYNGGSWTDTTI